MEVIKHNGKSLKCDMCECEVKTLAQFKNTRIYLNHRAANDH